MLSVLHSQYHACWCTGDCRSQCINRHGIDHQSRIIPSPASEELTLYIPGLLFFHHAWCVISNHSLDLLYDTIVTITEYKFITKFHKKCFFSVCHRYVKPGGRFKNTYELLNLRALKYSPVNKIHIFQCMGEIFCVEFQRYPLKFHTKYLTHTLKDMISIQHWNFKSS